VAGGDDSKVSRSMGHPGPLPLNLAGRSGGTRCPFQHELVDGCTGRAGQEPGAVISRMTFRIVKSRSSQSPAALQVNRERVADSALL